MLGQRHYDVQLQGGAALHFGNIAEMKTGEGKTLTSVLPAYLNALAGKGVHVVTVNDYLARRDAEWMGQVHQFLGLTVGVILPNRPPAEHRDAYACDITYGTNNEFGFDYLRDNMSWSGEELVQRGHFFAIVDEVDSILIDEARTPADHLWPGRAVRPLVRRVLPGGQPATGRQGRRGRLRGRRGQADRRDQRARRGQGRGLARHRQPVRVAEHPAGRVPEQRAEGQGALPAGQGLHRQRR